MSAEQSMPIKPTLVIGLGGSGQWVLTYLKKNLQDTYGKVPETIRLLAFDTTSEDSSAAVAGEKEEKAQVSDVNLTNDEFVYLGGKIKKICEEIRDKQQHPHISSWLQSKIYLDQLSDDDFDISRGAGQRRPFGRMAIFYDLLTGQPKTLEKIDQALGNIRGAMSAQSSTIEIYIACSIAGGTGAGMFIDMTHLIRQRCQRAGIDCVIRGFIVLQNTFETVVTKAQDKLIPNAFAAMRELDRFMLMFGRDYPINYTSKTNQTALQTVYSSKLFDSCFLFDSKNAGSKSLLEAVEPKYSIYPMVADAMTILVDAKTGDTFTQHFKNVGNTMQLAQKREGKALYSSLGVFSYILPIRDMIDRGLYRLISELVGQKLVVLDEQGRVTGQGNSEYKQTPDQEASAFLSMVKSSSDKQNIKLNNETSTMMQQDLGNGQLQAQWATRGTDLLYMIEPVQSDNAVDITKKQLDHDLNMQFATAVPTSESMGEDHGPGADRVKSKISQERDRLLGKEFANKARQLGAIEQGLNHYHKLNQQRFRELLMETVERLLNGASNNVEVARSGKLVYVRDFLGALLTQYTTFETFIQNVIQTRNTGGILGEAEKLASDTLQTMVTTKNRTGSIDYYLRKIPQTAQRFYIQAEDNLLDLQRGDLIFRAIRTQLSEAKKLVSEMKQEIERWINMLTQGFIDEKSQQQEVGLYNAAQEQLKAIKNRQALVQKVAVHKYLEDAKAEEKLYQELIADKWGEILAQFQWKLGEVKLNDAQDTINVNVRLLYDLANNKELFLTPPRYADNATWTNLQALADRLKIHFRDIEKQQIIDYMATKSNLPEAEVVKELKSKTSAAISFEEHTQGAAENARYICVNASSQPNYATNMANALKTAGRPTDAVTDFSNKYRCSMLVTTDIIIGENTTPYQDALKKYLTEYHEDHSLLHNFAAEINSSKYENRLDARPLSQNKRILSPQVVALLENEELAKSFVFSWIYGLIQQQETTTTAIKGNQWVLYLDTPTYDDRAAGEPSRLHLAIPTQDNPTPDLMEAMTNYVFLHIDRQTGVRSIKDMNPQYNVLVSPEKVKEQLKLREEFIEKGLNGLTTYFEDTLKRPEFNIMLKVDPQILVGALRLFINQHERELRSNNEVAPLIDQFLDDNRDCYHEDHQNQIAELVTQAVSNQLNGPTSLVKKNSVDLGKRAKIKLLEEKLGKIRVESSKIPNNAEPKKEDVIARDFYSVLHLMIWDEVERLKKLTPK